MSKQPGLEGGDSSEAARAMSDRPRRLALTPLADADLAFVRAMEAWEASLKRPDLDERHRVAGALSAYQSQLDACAIVEQRFVDHLTGGGEEAVR